MSTLSAYERRTLTESLTEYEQSFVAPRLCPLEIAGAELESVTGFFGGLGRYFETAPTAAEGCLIVNTIADLAGRDDLGDTVGMDFQQRLAGAFRNALSGTSARTDADPLALDGRCQMLVAHTLGVWHLARINPADAARACQAIVDEMAGWA